AVRCLILYTTLPSRTLPRNPRQCCRESAGDPGSHVLVRLLAWLLDMTGVSHLLEAIASGDSDALAQLLPLVYDGLRRLAARPLAHEAPSQTLAASRVGNDSPANNMSTRDLR